MGIDPSTLSPAFKACIVPGLIPKIEGAPIYVAPAPVLTKTVRTPLDKLNKTERRLYDLLMASNRFTEVIPHGITFHLGYDMHYTPDFVCLGELKVLVVESKGAFIFARALNKFKACAIRYRCFNFELHEWKEKSWHVTKFS